MRVSPYPTCQTIAERTPPTRGEPIHSCRSGAHVCGANQWLPNLPIRDGPRRATPIPSPPANPFLTLATRIEGRRSLPYLPKRAETDHSFPSHTCHCTTSQAPAHHNGPILPMPCIARQSLAYHTCLIFMMHQQLVHKFPKCSKVTVLTTQGVDPHTHRAQECLSSFGVCSHFV